MQFRLTGLTAAALGGAALSPAAAQAQTLDLSIDIPKLRVAEYHKPYVAVWLEKPGVKPRTISVWYNVAKAKGEGTKWLNDVRQWWRASGRTMRFPADGISGATRPPGNHKMRFTAGSGGMPGLTPGNYTLVVEAAREAGGREIVRLPFLWNGTAAAAASTSGKSELGAVSFALKR